MNITDFFFDEAVQLQDWPHCGGKFVLPAPDTLLLHFTDLADVESAIDVLAVRKLSAHVLIGRDGTITQMLPFNRVGWHAGDSAFAGREGYNNYAIGIEIDNCGRLIADEASDGLLASCGKIIPISQVMTGIHANEHVETAWHAYATKQLAQLEKVCRSLVDAYEITSILGHDQVAAGRKIDPGPALPISHIRATCLGTSLTQQKECIAGAPLYPVLDRPDRTAQPILVRSLAAGTRFIVDKQNDEWRRILFSVEGYVRSREVQQVAAAKCMTISKGANLQDGSEERGTLFTTPLPKGAVIRCSGQTGSWYRASVRCAGWVFREKNLVEAP